MFHREKWRGKVLRCPNPGARRAAKAVLGRGGGQNGQGLRRFEENSGIIILGMIGELDIHYKSGGFLLLFSWEVINLGR